MESQSTAYTVIVQHIFGQGWTFSSYSFRDLAVLFLRFCCIRTVVLAQSDTLFSRIAMSGDFYRKKDGDFCLRNNNPQTKLSFKQGHSGILFFQLFHFLQSISMELLVCLVLGMKRTMSQGLLQWMPQTQVFFGFQTEIRID